MNNDVLRYIMGIITGFIGREFNVLISGKKLTQSETIELLNMEIKNHFEQLEKEGKK